MCCSQGNCLCGGVHHKMGNARGDCTQVRSVVKADRAANAAAPAALLSAGDARDSRQPAASQWGLAIPAHSEQPSCAAAASASVWPQSWQRCGSGEHQHLPSYVQHLPAYAQHLPAYAQHLAVHGRRLVLHGQLQFPQHAQRWHGVLAPICALQQSRQRCCAVLRRAGVFWVPAVSDCATACATACSACHQLSRESQSREHPHACLMTIWLVLLLLPLQEQEVLQSWTWVLAGNLPVGR